MAMATSSSSSSDSALPIFAIVVLTILVTSFLIFVSRCCSHFNPFTWLRPSQSQDGPFIALSPTIWNRGLDESAIRDIPTFQFVKSESQLGDDHESTVYGCVVCLNEFQEHDMLKILPNCSHAFHLDCIDIWLQSNANCPLCRSSISGTNRCPVDNIVAPSSSPQDSQLLSNMGSDEDFVVIELGEEDRGRGILMSHQGERNIEGIIMGGSLGEGRKQRKLWQHVSIMGDECIDVRKKEEQFCIIQPLRRSFSMDSANDRQVYLDVQRQAVTISTSQNEASVSEDRHSNGNSSRGRRSFFPFRYGRGSKSAVLPLENE